MEINVDKLIKKVINKIESNGYEAYIVGGYVRDLLVGKSSFDIDIATNAIPKELLKIFPSANSKNLGGIDFKIKEYHFEITTYREEITYKNRRPITFNYVSSLITDLQRRDFTINTICMNKKGDIIDLLNGTEDLRNNKIRMVGDINIKIKEDPLRILRGIRIAINLNFSLESNLYKAFKEKASEILKLSNTRIKEELDKILLSDNVKNGFKLLEDLGIIKLLNISNYKDIVPVKNLEGMYAQITIGYNLPFTKLEKDSILKIREILKMKDLNSMTVYKYGLYLSLIASKIKNIDSNEINKIYKNLPIHERSEINITALDLMKKFNICGRMINETFLNLEEAIISNNLKNKRSEIIKYLNNRK